MEDDDASSDPPAASSERDRELYAAVLFRLKQMLEKLAREKGNLNPPPAKPDPEENSN